MTGDERFAHLEAARPMLLRWAPERGIPLHRVEYVVPLAEANPGLSAWLFFETDEDPHRAYALGWPERLAARFTETLKAPLRIRSDPGHPLLLRHPRECRAGLRGELLLPAAMNLRRD
ncbi:hypothetical protein OJF2_04200 [Aquisphaera giovannonii]|uniref:Uncharacterized protein n=1 Tax=Aquisphaera giovannonii TaxID=406548 RepID=A0A5B9VU97_9BACT|nr:hypothetical protein OJF2_04200 [Aquisphaera giovannonii]